MKQHIKNTLLVPHIAILFIVHSLILQPFRELINGFYNIQINQSILLTDYVAVSGLGPALLNSGILMGLSYLFIRKLDLKMTGSIFAGILTIGGFAFFGKNILNVSIIYLGVLLYAKYKKINIRSVIVVFLFSTGLSPISSVVMFGLGLDLLYSIPFGIMIGLMSGFLLVELASRAITFHQGYNLYNVGFASGIISFTFFSLFKAFGLDYQTQLLYTNDSHQLLLNIFIALMIVFLILGLWLSEGKLSEYKNILKQSGRAATDFTRRDNQPLTMINIGLTGLVALVIVLLLGIKINGPVFGGLFTIAGFSAFGKHVRNIVPPMVGVFIMSTVLQLDLSVPVVLAILFSTALAPVSGEHGWKIGIVAGMLHLPINIALGQLHGGILLYANGFAASFTAIIITSFVQSLQRSET